MRAGSSVVFALFALAAMTGFGGTVPSWGEPPERLAQRAQKLYGDGNYAEAYDLFRGLALDGAVDGASAADALDRAVDCLRSLNREDETDALREGAVEAHPRSWRLLWRAAESWFGAGHYGYVVAGEFRRGQHRGGGRYVNTFERDRVLALRLMERAVPFTAGDGDSGAVSQFHLRFAAMLLGYRGYGGAWRLQYLTDLGELPDYEEGYGYPYGSGDRGAPVDPGGSPVFHSLPESWVEASSDGQRWRWMLDRAVKADPAAREQVRMDFAAFLQQQFGVQTLASWGDLLRGARGKEEGDGGAFSLHTLGDEETIARLATGVKRFALPREFNFLAIYHETAAGQGGRAEQAVNALAQIYENRRQYDRAAEQWRLSIRRHGDPKDWKKKRLAQIVDPWGSFETVFSQPAGEGAKVEYRFRNGRKVRFEARRIKVPELLTDVKSYLRSNPRQLDHERMNVEQIGWRLVRNDERKYIDGEAASWQLDLDPHPLRFDRVAAVATPLQEAGAYLLTARLEGGNTSRIVVWVSDTVIVRKALEGGDLFFVADAVTGDPLPEVPVDFFGYRQERTDWERVIGRRYNVETKQFTYRTGADGLLVPNPSDFTSGFSWLITAGGGGGRLAYLGWRGVWGGARYDREYKETKVYCITDRPVYRPAQAVKFKVWVAQAKYDQEGPSIFQGRAYTLHIVNPMNEKVFEKTFTADRWGGFDGEFVPPAGAALGVYRLVVPGLGGGTFRVEEYKKPEFEVKVEAPGEPVALGETIGAVISASYYFGAPVTQATVRYKVLRRAREARWYPPGPWDWLYGQGYWWFACDYPWYPGWNEWGVPRPVPWWWPAESSPPEVVAEAEQPVGEDGRVEVRIDTAFAREVFGDTDHRYEIVAEVTDRSRRTIVGRGEVIAARQPFRVHAWVDRGYYRVGDAVRADFAALTVDGRPVEGGGVLELLKVTYEEGAPRETAVQSWNLRTDAEGRASRQLTASESGQYRLSLRVTDGRGRTMEGGHLFVVRGRGFDGRGFRFNQLELVPDRSEYAPGEEARIAVNTDRSGGTVLLFTRPVNGVYLRPRVMRLDGKSAEWAVRVSRADMPNFFVEALTVSGGRVFTETREIVVPPEKRVLDVEVRPAGERLRPGEEAKVSLRLTDREGRPFAGSAAVAVYDRSVEYVSGGSNVPEIKAFFWKWRRLHQPRGESSLERFFGNLVPPGDAPMRPIGVFGRVVVDEMGDARAAGAGGGARQGLKTKMNSVEGEAAMAPAAAPMERGALSDSSAAAFGDAVGKDDAGAAPAEQEAAVRREFADTAFWAAAITTGEDGTAAVSFPMPENLTTWKIRVWAMGDGSAVGEGAAETVTAKDLILRLQSPRFFVEKDEVVLSANIHNYLPEAADVRALLELEGGVLEAPAESERRVRIEPGGEARVDWRVRALGEGEATVRMKALSAAESDAVEMRFPVFVHGMLRTDSVSGVLRPDDDVSSFSIEIPAERRLEQSRLEVRWSPSLAGAMVDALPYLADYPYGCTEQTLNRFLPTVVTRKVLLDMGLDLESIRAKRTNLNAQEIGDGAGRAAQWKRRPRNPVFDEEVVDDMVRRGVMRLAGMQLSDGGWGWFSGWGERSTPHTTATVVRGLITARSLGVQLPAGMLERGTEWLAGRERGELEKLRNADGRRKPWKEKADNLDALVHMVLVEAGGGEGAMGDFLYRDRGDLSVYAMAMLGMALHRRERTEELAMVMRNIGQFLVEDAENQTAWLDLPGGAWWHWYGSEYEAHAFYLKLLAATEPGSPRAAGLVKYLLNNRRHATYWNSTRDTALCVEALADYLRSSGEGRPDMTVEVRVDGVLRKSEGITSDNLFSFDNALVLEGRELSAGRHDVEIRRLGEGPVYFNAYVTNFTLEDPIRRAGLEVKVRRKYYRLRREDRSVKAAGSRGQAVDQRVERYAREPLENLGAVASGDLVEVELEIESKNDYEYLVFEDMKPAGFEPLEVRSGYGGNDMGAYAEYRDERVVFFVRQLARGEHSVSYRMRAEIPGRFSALPAKAQAMYAPELRANSDEIKLEVRD